MANEFIIRKGFFSKADSNITGSLGVSGSTTLYNSGSLVLDVQGSLGRLFSITDSLSGDIFSVAPISGIPILNVNSNGTSSFDGVVFVDGIIQKSGSTNDDILLGDGSTTSLSGISPSSISGLVSGSSQLTSSYDTRYELQGRGIISGSDQVSGSFVNITGDTMTGDLSIVHDSASLYIDSTGGSGDAVINARAGTRGLVLKTNGTENSSEVGHVLDTVNNTMSTGFRMLQSSINFRINNGEKLYLNATEFRPAVAGIDNGSAANPWQNVYANDYYDNGVNINTLYEEKASGTHTLVSGSSQINYPDISNIPSGIISGSEQLPSGLLSGSHTDITNLNNFTSSIQDEVDGLSSQTSSYLLNTTDTLDGDLTVTGTITAQEFHTEFISGSIIYESGSTKFGDTSDDTHEFTGSVSISGSLSITDNSLVTNLNADRLDSQHGTYYLDYTNFTNIPSGLLSGSHTDITNLNSYTSSNDSVINGLNSYTQSNDTTNTNQDNRLTSLENLTSSLDSTYEEIASGTHTLVSGSSQIDVTQTTNYSSINQYTDSDNLEYLNSISVLSGSKTDITSLNSYTSSNDTTNTNQDNRLTSLEAATSSYESTLTFNDTSTINFNRSTNTITAVAQGGIVSQSLLNNLTDSEVNQLANIDSTTISTTQWGYLGTLDQPLTTTSNVTFNDIVIDGSGSIAGDLTIYGDLTAFGSASFINSDILVISDPMIYLNDGGGALNPDIGLAAGHTPVSTYSHTGFFRDASDNGTWKVYDNYVPEPTGSIDIDDGTFNLAPFQAGVIKGTSFIKSGSTSDDILLGDGTTTSLSGIDPGSISGLVSGSSQIDVTQTTNYSSINQYTDTDNLEYLNSISVLSGSKTDITSLNSYTSSNDTTNTTQNGRLTSLETLTSSLDSTYEEIASGTHTLVSGSSQINYPDITNIPSGIISSSNVAYTNVDNNFSTNQTITGSLSATTINRVQREYGKFTNSLGANTVEENALIHGMMNNKFRFRTASLQEESTDGTTWTTSSRATSDQLGDLMIGEGQGTSFQAIPAPGIGNDGYYRLTWDASGYEWLDNLYIYCSTESLTVNFKLEGNHNTNGWTTLNENNVSNWPGHVFLPQNVRFHPSNAAMYSQVRLEFSVVSATNANKFTLYQMEWYGSYPAGKRNVETYDRLKNVTFPVGINSSTVTATTLVKSGATDDDILLGDGTTTSLSGIDPGSISGLVSGSIQVIDILTSLNNFSSSIHNYTSSNNTTNTTQNGRLTNIEAVTSSYESTLTFNDTSTINFNRSTNTITAVAQGGIISGSGGITPITNLLYEEIASGTHTLVSGSSQINYPDITNIPAGIISSSNVAYTNVNNNFSTTQDIDGDLTVTGIITATEFHTDFVSSSVLYSSGSTKFGNSSDDTHEFTGSVSISGSLSITDNTLVSNLNADLLDSQHGTYYLDYGNFTNIPSGLLSGSGYLKNTTDTFTGLLTIDKNVEQLRLNITAPTGSGYISWYDGGGLKAFTGYASEINEIFYISNQEASNIQLGTNGRTNDFQIDSTGNAYATHDLTVTGTVVAQNGLIATSTSALGSNITTLTIAGGSGDLTRGGGVKFQNNDNSIRGANYILFSQFRMGTVTNHDVVIARNNAQMAMFNSNGLNVAGSISGSSIIKTGGTNDDILLGDGTTTSLSGIDPGSISGLVSGSSQINYPDITNIPSGLLSGSHTDITSLNNFTSSIQTEVDGLSAQTSSYGTVTSVGGTGTKNGLTLTGTVTTSGNLTLGGTLSINNSDWSGTDLSVANGGTGVSTITGVVIGNGTSAMTGVTGTASQLLRRNAGNTAYEFFTPTYTSNTGDITRVNITAGNGLSGTTVDTTSGDHTQTLAVGEGTGITITSTTVNIDYLGTNNFIDSATNLEGTVISTGDTIVYHDATDNNVKKGFVSDLPFEEIASGTHTLVSGSSQLYTDLDARYISSSEHWVDNGTTLTNRQQFDTVFVSASNGYGVEMGGTDIQDVFKIRRNQNQIGFTLGNHGISQPHTWLSTNTFDHQFAGTGNVSLIADYGGSQTKLDVPSKPGTWTIATLDDITSASGSFETTGRGILSGSSYALDVNVLHTTGNESFTGIKSTSNTSSGNGFVLTNGTSATTSPLGVTNNSTTAVGISVSNNSSAEGIKITNTSSGEGLSLLNSFPASGKFITAVKTATEVMYLDNSGNLMAVSLIKKDATADDVLLGDGSTTSLSTIDPGSISGLVSGSSQVAINSTTGTLNVNKGGTGQTTYTNGQLLIGNTTGNTLTKATLTQGTGITITNGAGSITIEATNNGTVTAVNNGNGMNFTNFTTSGTVTLGTPSTLTPSTTNALTTTSHTHAITGLVKISGPSGTHFDGTYLQFNGDGTSNNDYISYNDTTNAFYFNADTTRQITTGNATVVASTFNGSLSGNATTATTWQTARTLTIGSTGKSVNGSANVSWTLGEIGAAATLHSHGSITSAGAITGTTVLASGDGLIFADSSNSGVLKRSSITIGASTTTYLRNDGTWGTPAGTGVTGTGTTNYVSKWTGTSSQGNSSIYNGAADKVSIGNTNTTYNLDVSGTGRFTGTLLVDNALSSNIEATSATATTEIATVAIATYSAAFFDFLIKNGTNVRSGTVYAIHDGTNVEYVETSTVDLGDTTDVTLTVDISAGNMRLLATTASSTWTIKSLVRAL